MNNKSKLLFCAFFLSGFLVWQNAEAACTTWDGNTCVVSSCDYSNISSDIAEIKTNALGKTGVVIMQLPECDITQTTDLSFSMTSGFSGITEFIIRGYGTEPIGRGSAGLTKITNRSIVATLTSNKKFRMSNITFSGAANDNWAYNAFIRVNGTSNPSTGGGFRFDHMTWTNTTVGDAYYGADNSSGVVDSNYGTFHGQFSTWEMSSDTYGNSTWNTGASLGTQDAIYFENNELTCTDSDKIWMVFDGAQGARLVARYNTLSGFYFGGHDSGSNYRSMLQYEIINNYLVSNMSYGAGLMTLRGGTGIVFGNRMYHSDDTPFSPSTSSGIHLKNVRSSDGTGGVNPSSWYTYAMWCGDTDVKMCLGTGSTSFVGCTTEENCGGTTGVTNYCIDVDGGVGTAYPCRDQIGTGDNSYPQASKPFLFWDNKVKRASGSYIDSPPYIYNGVDNILINRDYCTNESTMPAVCNDVVSSYTQYTCPHPFVGTGSCDSDVAGTAGYSMTGDDVVAPAAPSGLAVT